MLLLSASLIGCRALLKAVVFGSGAPPAEERERLEEREDRMVAERPGKRIEILPVAILNRRKGFDHQGAETLARRLQERGVPGACASKAPLILPFTRQANEAAIYWERWKAFSSSVKARPRSDVDSVRQLDVFGLPEKGRVEAVHVMSTTAKGEMAYGRLWNSHRDLFQEISPRSVEGGRRGAAPPRRPEDGSSAVPRRHRTGATWPDRRRCRQPAQGPRCPTARAGAHPQPVPALERAGHTVCAP